MRVKSITVDYGLTQSLPDYCNVKPALRLEAELDDDDTAAGVSAALWTMAQLEVQAIVDDALEQAGKAARYSDEPRYRALRTFPDKYELDAGAAVLIVVLPQDTRPKQLDERQLSGANYYGESLNLRYAHAQRVATRAVADCLEHEQRCVVAVLRDTSESELAVLETALRDAAPTKPVERPKPFIFKTQDELDDEQEADEPELDDEQEADDEDDE